MENGILVSFESLRGVTVIMSIKTASFCNRRKPFLLLDQRIHPRIIAAALVTETIIQSVIP